MLVSTCHMEIASKQLVFLPQTSRWGGFLRYLYQWTSCYMWKMHPSCLAYSFCHGLGASGFFFATGLYKDGRSGCPAPILADPDLSALFPTFNHLFSYNLVLITHYLDHEEGRYICSSPCLVPNATGRNLFTLLFTLNLPPSLGFLSLFLPSPSSINPLAHLSSRITNEYLIGKTPSLSNKYTPKV